MADIESYEARIRAALDRIEAARERLGAEPSAPAADPAELTRLQEALDSERMANAQLEERVKALHDRQESVIAGLEAEVAKLRGELSRKNAETQELKRVSDQLRMNNRMLRSAAANDIGTPDAINDAMKAELDVIRANHDADRADLDAILAELRPLVQPEEGKNA